MASKETKAAMKRIKSWVKKEDKELKELGIKIDIDKKADPPKIKIEGNPYSLKSKGKLPKWLEFNGKEFVDKTTIEPVYFDVEPKSKAVPLKEIKDPLDLLWALQCLNPDIRILDRNNTGTFEIDPDSLNGKNLSDLIMPNENFKFDSENGIITNNNSVASGFDGKPLAIRVTTQTDYLGTQVTNIGDNSSEYLSRFENGGQTFLNDNNSGDFRVQDVMKAKYADFDNLSTFDISSLNATPEEVLEVYRKYALVPDHNGNPVLQQKFSGAENGQLVTDDRLINMYQLADAVIKANFANANYNDKKQLGGEINSFTATDYESFLDMLRNYMSNPDAAKQTVEQVYKEREESPDVGSDGDNKYVTMAERVGVNVVENSEFDDLYATITMKAREVQPIINRNGELVLLNRTTERYEETSKILSDQVLLFYAVIDALKKEKEGIEINEGDINTTLKSRFLEVYNNQKDQHQALIEEFANKMRVSQRDKEFAEEQEEAVEMQKEMINNFKNWNN